MGRRLHVCYVPGLDRRSVCSTHAPRLQALLDEYGSTPLDTQPTTELFPTLVTGVNPGQHQIWNVSLRPDAASVPKTWFDRLPDPVTTFAQCLWHFANPKFELPALPPRRRRRFDLHRLKFDLRLTDPELVKSIGGCPTLFGMMEDDARYLVIKKFADLPTYARTLPEARLRFDMVEFHAYDLASHWNLDNPAVMSRYLRELDAFIGAVQDRCRDAGVTFVLLVDHGQERVVGSVDVMSAVESSGVPREEYDYFVAVAGARFWFHTDRARERVTASLRALPHVNLLHNDELRQYGVDLDAERFGELYAITDQGYLFFPHDFYQPLGSLFLGLKNPLMRPRLRSGVHRGYHGHVPNHPAEVGYMVVADRELKPAGRPMSLIDFAPTMLDLLGMRPPAQMTGRAVLEKALAPAVFAVA